MTYNKHTCPIDHPGLRRDFIGSSDAVAIMGVSPWDTPFSLWETKLGLRQGKDLTTAMIRGIENEDIARKYVEELYDIKLPAARVFSEKHSFLMANFDGLSSRKKVGIEIKCPGKDDHSLAEKGLVPDKYYPQLQHLMMVGELSEIHYVSYKDNEVFIVLVKANEEYQKELFQKEKQFYENIVNFTEPEKTDRDYVKRNDIAWRNLAQRYVYLKGVFDQYDQELTEVRQALIYEAKGNSSEGSGIKIIKSNRKGNVDYAKIPELKEIDLEQYRKPSIETWRII